MKPVAAQHIESVSEKCGGKPCIAGTRIRVWDIHIWHDLHGQSPEEIVVRFPQVSVADVHAALAYYLDHRKAIDQQMRDAGAFVDATGADQGPTRFDLLRDELLKGKDVHDDSVSSG